jgi:hypothetical protein
MIYEWLNEDNIHVLTSILKDVLIKCNCDIFYVRCSIVTLKKDTLHYYFGFTKDIASFVIRVTPYSINIMSVYISNIRYVNILKNNTNLIVEKLQYHIRNEKLKTLLN